MSHTILAQRVREIQRQQQRLEKLKSNAPPAWFQVTRLLDVPSHLVSEQLCSVSVKLHNLGREARTILYTEKPSNNIVINKEHQGKSIKGNMLQFKVNIKPNQTAVFDYSFYFTQAGEATIAGTISYKGQIQNWDSISEDKIHCTSNAPPPRISVSRYYRYRPETTEILLKIGNATGNRIAYKLNIEEKYQLGGRERFLRLTPSRPDLLPGEITWTSYQIEGHLYPEDINFDPANKVQFRDGSNKESFQVIDTTFELLKYERLYNNEIVVGRNRHILQLKEIVDSALEDVERSNRHVIHITGPQGSGKSRLLWALREEAERKGFRFVGRLVQRNANTIARMLEDVLGVRTYDRENLRERIADIDCLRGENNRRYRDLFYSYLMDEIKSSDTDVGPLTTVVYDVLRYYTEKQPLVITLDDAHELNTVNDLQLLENVILRFAESQTPIIFAFAEIQSDVDDFENSFAYRLKRVRNFLKLQCAPLSEDQCNTLIDLLIDYPKFDSQLKSFVYKLSEGVPQDTYDILIWLTTSERALGLYGDLWTKTEWLSREEARFDTVTRILPRFAENYLNKESFTFLRVLSVVGEVIPLQLAIELHKEILEEDSEATLQERIKQLVKLGFLNDADRGSGNISFSHLSRRNSIYEDPDFPIEGRTGKKAIRYKVFEIIKDNVAIYVHPDEQRLQAAHHLLRCDIEHQKLHSSILAEGARIALQRRDLRLGREFTYKAIELSPHDDLQIMRLRLLLGDQILILTKRYDEAAKLLQETDQALERLKLEKATTQKELESLWISATNVKTQIYLTSPESEDIEKANKLSKDVINFLEKRKPRYIPFFSRPDLEKFPYMELLVAYTTHFRSVFRRMNLRKPQNDLAQYGNSSYAQTYERKATSLAKKLLSRGKNVIPPNLLQIEIEFADLYEFHKEYDKAAGHFETVRRLARKYNLSFYEGRALQGIARASLQSSLAYLEAHPGHKNILALIFDYVISLKRDVSLKLPWEFKQAKSQYEEALQAHSQVDDRIGMMEAYAVLGIFYHLSHSEVEALSKYEQAISLYRQSGDVQSRWICLLGAISLRLDQQNWIQAMKIWNQMYEIYEQYLEEEDQANRESLGFLEFFAQIAQQIEPFFAEQQKLEYQEQAIDVQWNELPETTDDLIFHSLLLRKGDILIRGERLPEASEAYQESLEFASPYEKDFRPYVESCWRLIKLYQNKLWKPSQSIPANQVWSNDEAEFHFEALCRVYLNNNEMPLFFDTCEQFLQTIEKNKTYARFPKTYIGFLSTMLGTYSIEYDDLTEQDFLTNPFFMHSTQVMESETLMEDLKDVDQFVNITIDHHVKYDRFIEAAELATYTGMQFLQSNIPIENAEQLGIQYFITAENLFTKVGKDEVIYSLNGILFGYLMLGEKAGFGRCALRLLDWMLSVNDLEECNFLLDDLLTDYSARERLSEQHLAELITRLEHAKPKIVKQENQYVTSILLRKAAAHLFLGEKYANARKLRSRETEIKRALRAAADLLGIRQIDRDQIFNLIGLCYSALSDTPRQIVSFQESARANQLSTGSFSGVSLANLANSYAEYGLFEYMPPLIETAFTQALKACISYDLELKRKDVSDPTLRSLVIQAARVRSNLHQAISIWARYIKTTNTPEKVQYPLMILEQEQDLLRRQIADPLLIFRQPFVNKRWPLHVVHITEEEEEHHQYRLQMELNLPINRITLEEAIGASIPNAPSVTEMLEEIFAIDIEALNVTLLEDEEPASEVDVLFERLRAMGITSKRPANH